jgi:hypothetical protein
MERLLTLIMVPCSLNGLQVAAQATTAHRLQEPDPTRLTRGFRADAAAPKKNSLPHF